MKSFGEGECDDLRQLSSGILLVKCMKNVKFSRRYNLPFEKFLLVYRISDLAAEAGREWEALFDILREF